jgi:hypothetical protein
MNGLSLSCNVTPPALTSISGPSTLVIPAGSTYVNASFTALPNISSDEVVYQWSISPNTNVNLSIDRFNLGVYFMQPGTYAITCKTARTCYPSIMLSSVTKVVTVSQGVSHYSVSNTASNQIIVELVNKDLYASSPSKFINYQLYDQSNGTLVASGKISVLGGTLDCSSLPSGVYLLQLNDGKIYEVHRILLK